MFSVKFQVVFANRQAVRMSKILIIAALQLQKKILAKFAGFLASNL